MGLLLKCLQSSGMCDFIADFEKGVCMANEENIGANCELIRCLRNYFNLKSYDGVD